MGGGAGPAAPLASSVSETAGPVATGGREQPGKRQAGGGQGMGRRVTERPKDGREGFAYVGHQGAEQPTVGLRRRRPELRGRVLDGAQDGTRPGLHPAGGQKLQAGSAFLPPGRPGRHSEKTATPTRAGARPSTRRDGTRATSAPPSGTRRRRNVALPRKLRPPRWPARAARVMAANPLGPEPTTTESTPFTGGTVVAGNKQGMDMSVQYRWLGRDCSVPHPPHRAR